jgi:hypothetical protein
MTMSKTITARHGVTPEGQLRLAHQRAFGQIRSAGSDPEYQTIVAQAVQELVAACEAYARARADGDRRASD